MYNLIYTHVKYQVQNKWIFLKHIYMHVHVRLFKTFEASLITDDDHEAGWGISIKCK